MNSYLLEPKKNGHNFFNKKTSENLQCRIFERFFSSLIKNDLIHPNTSKNFPYIEHLQYNENCRLACSRGESGSIVIGNVLHNFWHQVSKATKVNDSEDFSKIPVQYFKEYILSKNVLVYYYY